MTTPEFPKLGQLNRRRIAALVGVEGLSVGFGVRNTVMHTYYVPPRASNGHCACHCKAFRWYFALTFAYSPVGGGSFNDSVNIQFL